MEMDIQTAISALIDCAERANLSVKEDRAYLTNLIIEALGIFTAVHLLRTNFAKKKITAPPMGRTK